MSDCEFHPDEDLPLCGYCEEEMAILFCAECDCKYCRECGEVIHKRAKMRSHQLQRIADLQSSDAGSHSTAAKSSSATSISHSQPQAQPAPVQQAQTQSAITIQFPEDSMVETTTDDDTQLPVSEWGLQSVVEWLQQLGAPYASYASVFKQHEVRGKTLQLCDAAALLSLGVAKDHCAHLETLIYLLRLQEQNQIITTQLSQPPMA
eukprot:m.59837 g.59837  ORF g.59837 m.59837 type:complete len:206 (+) comp11783_c0_seq8:271-888(+)